MSLAIRTIANVMWRISSGMFRLVATFMATPFIISRLGDHDYGLLIALSVFVGYFATLDLDLGTAVSKYTAEFSASGQHAEMLRMVRTALSIFIAIGLAIAVLISLSSGWIVDRVIMVPAPQRDTAQMILILFAACFVFNMIAWIYGGVLAGLHRSDMLSWIGFAQVVVYFGVIVGLLLAGYGVFEVAAFQAIEPIYISLAFYWMARRASPSVSALPAFDPASARMLVKLSSVTMVGKIALGASRRLDTILIGAMGSLATIPYYTAPGLPVGIFIRLMVLFESLAIPLASELATREKDRSAALYLRATRLCALTSLLLALPLFIFATDLLATWMGEVFAERGGGLLRVLLIGNLALVISSIGGAMLVGRGEASPYSISRLVTACVVVSLYVVLIPRFGIEGAAMGFAVPNVLAAAVFTAVVVKKLGISTTEFLLKTVAPLVALAGLGYGAGWLIHYWIGPVRGWFTLLFAMGLTALAALASAAALAILKPEDYSVLGRTLRLRERWAAAPDTV